MRVAVVGGILFIGLAALPSPAAAQPTLFICTPASQVLKVQGGTVSVLYTHSSATAFHDCVYGPDGRLYIAADIGVLRINPAAPGSAENLAPGLPARGLAFNVSTLYFTVDDPMSGTSAVYQLAGSDPVDDFNPATDDGPVNFSGATPEQAFSIASSGLGIVFDYDGNMVVASGGALQRAAPADPVPPPPAKIYTSATNLGLTGIQPVGVALNTCKQIVYADASTNTLRRVGFSGALFSFGSKDIPQYIEIAADNTIYAVTKDKGNGAAKIWTIAVPFDTAPAGCSTASSAGSPVELKPLTTGRSPILPSALATGLALEPTHFALTRSFAPAAGPCSNSYDFGYHKVILNFENCSVFPSQTTITLTALKSTLSEATFAAPPFPANRMTTPIEGMRYSSMGGLVVQYVYTTSNPEVFPLVGSEFQSIFVFETQERIAMPGVARSAVDELTAAYDESVGDDYWDASVDPAGARGNDISKRVVFNAGLAQTCTLTFEEPFQTGNPLFKTGQNMNMGALARDANGAPCRGGTLRVSISQTEGAALLVKEVEATNSQSGNLLTEKAPGKYTINVDLTGYAPGTYDVFVWGSLTAPVHRTFVITK